jgi:hypothetical protein
MNSLNDFADRLQNAFASNKGDIVSVVDELLDLCRGQQLRLVWNDNRCRISAVADRPQEAIEIQIPQSVFGRSWPGWRLFATNEGPILCLPMAGKPSLRYRLSQRQFIGWHSKTRQPNNIWRSVVCHVTRDGQSAMIASTLCRCAGKKVPNRYRVRHHSRPASSLTPRTFATRFAFRTVSICRLFFRRFPVFSLKKSWPSARYRAHFPWIIQDCEL